MKKLLLIAAVASMSAPAFASKARITSLGNAAHLIDPQNAFVNPAYNTMMADYATFETGPSTTTSTTLDAEGGFVRSAGDAKYMAYLGRKSLFTTQVRSNLGFAGQENPIELQYAMKGAINWGVGFNYSSSDKKSGTIPQKQQAMGIRLGAMTDMWEAYGIFGLGSSATGTTGLGGVAALADKDATYKGLTGLQVGGAYKMENIYAYVQYGQDGAKFESATAANNLATTGLNGAEIKAQTTTVGVIDHNKIEGGQWFYGAAYQMTENKTSGGVGTQTDSKTTASSLPFLVGVEYDATSWATLRASVTQNVLLGTTKTETPSPTSGQSDTQANNTKVAVGAGLKFNKFVIDGSMTAGNTGNLNLGNNAGGTESLMTNVALTYTF